MNLCFERVGLKLNAAVSAFDPLIEMCYYFIYFASTLDTFAGSLAYVLFFILFFLKPFQNLFSIPSAGSSAVLITILGAHYFILWPWWGA
jgi:hypothetical protein